MIDKILIPGTYDPPTLGHLHIFERMQPLCRQLIVGVFINPEKHTLLTAEQRVQLLIAATAHLPRVRVLSDDGYVADFCRREAISLIVKGVRTEQDYRYEADMAAYNFRRGGVETLLLPADQTLKDVSSTAVRIRIAHGEPYNDLCPPEICKLLPAMLSNSAAPDQ